MGGTALIDIRYHLASLVAVFFALGLGMLTGAQLTDEGALAQEYGRLIGQIEEGLARVREDNRRLETRLAEANRVLAVERAYLEDVLGELVAERLPGVRIGMVVPQGAESYGERIWNGLLRAGADVHDVGGLLEDGWEVPDRGVTLFLWQGEEGSEERPVGTVWAWPGDGEFEEPEPPPGGARVVPEAHTVRGLLNLIGVLQEAADLVPRDGGEGVP